LGSKVSVPAAAVRMRISAANTSAVPAISVTTTLPVPDHGFVANHGRKCQTTAAIG
jgi:hypothetical protein